MADDLSSDSLAPRGIDLIAGTAGKTNRGISTPSTQSVIAIGAVAGGGVEVSGHGTARLDLVTSVAATSATVTIQTSFDNGVTDAWRTVAAFPAQTAVGTVRQVFTGLDRWVRANVTTLTTGPTTISLSGEIV